MVEEGFSLGEMMKRQHLRRVTKKDMKLWRAVVAKALGTWHIEEESLKDEMLLVLIIKIFNRNGIILD